MPAGLTKRPFTNNDLPLVQSFGCGEEPWEKEVSEWIKAPAGGGGGLDALEQEVKVWLYFDRSGNMLGFGSLAETTQRWPSSKDPKIPATVIPMLGLDVRYWGQPSGPPEERYANLILQDLVQEARALAQSHPILVLYVHVNNVRAIRFYERAGFQDLHKAYKDSRTGHTYKRMALALNADQ
jgi:GNAT superfamily N-acetyltransferase